MKNTILYFSILIIFFNTIIHGGTIDPKAKDIDHINYGTEYKCVVRLHGIMTINKDIPVEYSASAVVIKPLWILTAAHAVYNYTNHYILYNGQKINIDKIILPDNFNYSKFGEKDLALCHLQIPIILDFYPELYDNNDEVGKVVGLAGYGCTGTFSTGSIKDDGKKRAGSNTIDTIDRDLLICSVSKSPYTQMEFLIANGDSGGGLFINNKLAGIHSGIWNNGKSKPKSTYSTFSGHTRVSNYKSWILKNLD